MLIFHSDGDYQILLDTVGRHLLVEAAFAGKWITRLDMVSRSESHLSECLRDYTNLRFAVDALKDVPHDSAFWTLGFKGGDTYWRQRMGFVIGRKSTIGGKKQTDLFADNRPRRVVTEVTLTNSRGRFLIRNDGNGSYSVVFPDDPWGEPIIQGATSFDAAEKMDAIWEGKKL